MQRKSVVIDPTNMTPEEERLLRRLLEVTPTLYFMESYEFEGHEVGVLYDITPFKTNKPESNDAPNKVRYAVNLQVLGAGSQGEVMTIGVLSPKKEDDGLRYREETNYTKSAFVIKKERLPKDFEERKAIIEHRNKILTLATHLHAKKLELIKLPDGNYVLLIIMQQFKGQTLKSLLNELSKIQIHDRSKSESGITFQYNANFLFAITNLLLIAYKQQVLDAGLIHRDLKPDNIIVDLNLQNEFVHAVNTIDFEIAILQREQDHAEVGTPGYIAPELSLRGASTASDIYSLGVMLKILWAGRKQSEAELKVQELIDSMIDDDSDKRPTYETLLKNFSKYSMSSLYNFSDEISDVINQARIIGLETRKNLFELTRKSAFDQNDNAFNAVSLSQIISKIYGEQLQQLEKLIYLQGPDTVKLCIDQFISVLGSETLSGSLLTIENIKVAIQKILFEFESNVAHLMTFASQNQIDDTLIIYLQSKLNKCKTLDDFANFNTLYHKMIYAHEDHNTYGSKTPKSEPSALSNQEKLIQKQILYRIEKAYDIKQLHTLLAELKQKNYSFLRNKNFYTPNLTWINMVDMIQKKSCLLAEQDIKLLSDRNREKVYLEILKENPSKHLFSFHEPNINMLNFQKNLAKDREVLNKPDDSGNAPRS